MHSKLVHALHVHLHAVHFVCQDLHFVVLWSKEEEQLYDIIHAKDIIPPSDVDVLDIQKEAECRAKFQTKIYDVVIIAKGKIVV